MHVTTRTAIGVHVTLPSTCLAPIVLVHPNGIAGTYIASIRMLRKGDRPLIRMARLR
jgi:hypothetical protein